MFTAGCSVCEPIVEKVTSMACSDCEVIVYDFSETFKNKVFIDKAKTYNIKSLPAIAVDGKLLSCCQNHGISQTVLREAGIGERI